MQDLELVCRFLQNAIDRVVDVAQRVGVTEGQHVVNIPGHRGDVR